MKSVTDYLGLGVLEGIFFLSALLLVYSSCCGCFLTSLVLFTLVYFSYQVIRKRTARFLKTDGKYVLITGCDSGFGHGLAKQLDDLGCHVFATCVNENSPGAVALKNFNSERLKVLEMDVGSDESVAQCLKEVEDQCGKKGLWGVVNNAGINFLGDVELVTMKQYLHIGNVNVFGMVRVTKAFLPLVRQTKGRIVNVTSVKGRIALPCDSAYGITKYGGEAFSDILRLEMNRFGIKTIVVQPGNFGGITACLNEEGRQRIKNDFDEMWSNASEEIKEVYGKDYVDGFVSSLTDGAATTCPTIQPVLDAFKDALFNEDPQTRYLVSGGKGWLDIYCVLGILNGFIPSRIMDKLLTNQFMKGLPTPNGLKGKSKTD